MLKHLQPLPISEEMLGAYLEGNLTADEAGYVESCLKSDMDLQELVDDVGYTGPDWINENINDSNLIYLDDVLTDFELPDAGLHSIDSEWMKVEEQEVNGFEVTNDDAEGITIYLDVQDMGFNMDDNLEL